MSDPRNLPKVYGEKEIGRILKRATELQHREPSAPPAGVTLAELEEIAMEAGIDPSFLRRAAMEVESGGTGGLWEKVVGDELIVVRETTLEGEMVESGFERIVETLHAHSTDHGQPSLLGRTLTWRAETANKTRTIQLTVSSRDGTTQIRMEENLSQTAGGLIGGLTGGLGLGMGLGVGLPIGLEVLGSALFAVAAPIGITAVSFIGARWIYRATVQKRKREIAALFDRVVLQAQDSIDEAARSIDDGDEPAMLAPGASDG